MWFVVKRLALGLVLIAGAAAVLLAAGMPDPAGGWTDEAARGQSACYVNRSMSSAWFTRSIRLAKVTPPPPAKSKPTGFRAGFQVQIKEPESPP